MEEWNNIIIPYIIWPYTWIDFDSSLSAYIFELEDELQKDANFNDEMEIEIFQ